MATMIKDTQDDVYLEVVDINKKEGYIFAIHPVDGITIIKQDQKDRYKFKGDKDE